ncbi:MAG: Gfo/Idh/MocA family oxidoreductase [Kiritimatiellae bacterium]|nr:Gfo/Idh/MocA family oxidoreductase [Kiritimatiellia bacterium]
MKDFLRIGIVGLGARGMDAVKRLPLVPGAQIVAICDPASPIPRVITPNCAFFYGAEGYKALCQQDLDLVYIATDWAHHVPVALEAMECGKAAAIEVPAALTLEDCWRLVETSEKTGLPCVQLENCIYGETEMLAQNLAEHGLFGNLVHAESAYIHRLFGPGCALAEPWRVNWNLEHRGNQYVTHALGPVCRILGIGRDDALDYLVSLECDSFDFKAFAREQNLTTSAASMGDHNITLIRTRKGRTILLRHDVSSIRQRGRFLHIQGEKGIFLDEPLRIAFEPQRNPADLPKIYEIEWQKPDELAATRTKYMHPLWREHGAVAKTADKHGGMDYLMDLRLVDALRKGIPPDTDVYDLAETCSIAEISERSVSSRSTSIPIPSFRQQ